MNRAKSNEILKEIEEVIPEAKIQHHILSSPTVGKTHNWKQRGTSIVCDGCESSHGFTVKPGYQLCGIDKNGFPMLTQVY